MYRLHGLYSNAVIARGRQSIALWTRHPGKSRLKKEDRDAYRLLTDASLKKRQMLYVDSNCFRSKRQKCTGATGVSIKATDCKTLQPSLIYVPNNK